MDLGQLTQGKITFVEKIKDDEDYEDLVFNDFKLQLGEDDMIAEYVEGSHSNAKKWGQLKLMITELLFLSLYADDTIDTVIYAGAAPGQHIYPLSKMFSHLKFHLYDSAPFDKRLDTTENVEIFTSYFTDKDIDNYNKQGGNYLFISDIRNLSYDRNKINMRLNQEMIWKDMTDQQQWLSRLNFKHASLKFRLPFPEDFVIEKYGTEVDYLDGMLIKQPYTGSFSTECRLFVNGENIKFRTWDLKTFEQKMFHHNKVIRQQATYKHVITRKNEDTYPDKVYQHNNEPFMLTRDYDSTYLGYVVLKYMNKIGVGINMKNFKGLCDYIIKNINSRVIRSA